MSISASLRRARPLVMATSPVKARGARHEACCQRSGRAAGGARRDALEFAVRPDSEAL